MRARDGDRIRRKGGLVNISFTLRGLVQRDSRNLERSRPFGLPRTEDRRLRITALAEVTHGGSRRLRQVTLPFALYSIHAFAKAAK